MRSRPCPSILLMALIVSLLLPLLGAAESQPSSRLDQRHSASFESEHAVSEVSSGVLGITELARTLRTDYREIVPQGDLAFAAVAEALEIFDISDPQFPVSLAVLPIPGDWTRAVTPNGSCVYAASGLSGASFLYAADVSDPSAPVIADVQPCGVWPVAADIDGNYLFLADRAYGLRVYDISDPSQPAWAAELPVPTSPRDIVVRAGYAYMAVAPEGLVIIDVTSPTSPVAVGACNPPGSGYGITLADTIAFLAGDSFGICAISIANPNNPYQLGVYNTAGYAHKTAVLDSLLFVADAHNGVVVLNVKHLSAINQVASFDTRGAAYDLNLRGNTLLVADATGGIAVLNIADPTDPVDLGITGEAGVPRDVYFDGVYAFVAADLGGLKVVNFSVPTMPEVIARIPVGCEQAVSLLRYDSLLFVGSYSWGPFVGCIDVVNIADPTDPVVLGSTPAGVYIGDMAVRDHYLLAADGDFSVYDFADPTDPVRVGGVDEWYSSVLLLRGDYAYTDEGVYDISDPTAPVKNPDFCCWGLSTTVFAMSNGYLYRAAYFSEGFVGYVYSYNLIEPSAPAYIAHSELGLEAWSITPYGRMILVGLSDRLMAVNTPSPDVLDTLGTVWPTPLTAPFLHDNRLVAGGGDYLTLLELEPLCGDANGDGGVNVGDLTFLVAYLYKGGAAPPTMWAGDCNGDGSINVGDLTFLVNYIFRGGPFPTCP